MTPAGRNAIVVVAIVVLASSGILLKGFLSLRSDPSSRRHHHRRVEGPKSLISQTGRAPAEDPAPPAIPPRSVKADPKSARSANGEKSSSAAAAPETRTEGEFVLTERTPETVAAERSVQEKLEGAIFRNPGSDVAFVDCAEKPCRARAEARDLETLTALLRDLSGTYDGHLQVELRERLDPFMGRFFQADLLVGTKETAAVPSEPLTLQ